MVRLRVALVAASMSACSSTDAPASFDGTTSNSDGSSEESSSTGPVIPPLPPLQAAVLTTEERIVPTHERIDDHGLDPRVPSEREELIVQGYGEHEVGAGEAIVDRTHDMSAPPPSGPNPRLLTRFVHLADAQLLDDESPVRAVNVDLPFFGSPFRPQESYSCLVLNAAVRTINAIHLERPLDFVILGGDNIDSAQTNELDWFLGIMDGAGSVHCDSGDDDDPVPGEGNDSKDPFGPVALDVPWHWVSGNHDILVQGVFQQSPSRQAEVVGSIVTNGGGTRDWSRPGGPTTETTVVADPARALLPWAEMMSLIAGSGDGHGIDDDVIAFGRAHYTFEQGGVRFVVVESATADGATDGVILPRDVDEFLRPAFDAAEAAGEPVIVVSHHASSQISDGNQLGGQPHDDAITREDWEALLAEYPGVVMHLAGHIHHHRIGSNTAPEGTPYWEALTGALADYPHQMRLVEIRDEDNGMLSITGIAIDYSTTGDPLAAEGRALGIADHTSAWLEDGSGGPEDRNVRLWAPMP